MTDVRFYHLTRSPLEQALPVMLERTLSRGARAAVLLGTTERCEALNQQLWTYNDESFLPHGTQKEGAPENQPIWLTTEVERPNGAGYLFFADGMLPKPAQLEGVEVCAILFDGRDTSAVGNARECWKALRDAGIQLTYWSQEERGWKESASANKPEVATA